MKNRLHDFSKGASATSASAWRGDMTEHGFWIFQNVIEVADAVLCAAYFFVAHFFLVFEKKRNVFLRLFFSFLFGLMYLSVSLLSVLGIIPWKKLYICLFLLLFSGILIRCLKENVKWEIFLCTLFFSCYFLSDLMLESMQFVLQGYFVRSVTSFKEILLRTAIVYGIVSGIGIFLFAAMGYMIGNILRNMKKEFNLGEFAYLMLIPVVGVLFFIVMLRMSFITKEKEVFLVYETYPAFRWVIPCLSILIYAGTVLSVSLFQKMKEAEEENNRIFAEQKEMLVMKEQMERDRESYDKIARFRHEMNGHLTNMQGLWMQEKYVEMGHYLESKNGTSNFNEKGTREVSWIWFV